MSLIMPPLKSTHSVSLMKVYQPNALFYQGVLKRKKKNTEATRLSTFKKMVLMIEFWTREGGKGCISTDASLVFIKPGQVIDRSNTSSINTFLQ